MKVAFLNFYSGFVARGGETFVHELANHMVGNNDITVFQAGPKQEAKYDTVMIGNFKQTEWLSHLPVTNILRRLFLDSSKLRELLFTLKLLPKLIRLHPDVVIPLNSGWQALTISIYCRLTNSKLVVAGQSGPGWDDRWNLLMKPHLFVALTQHQLDWAKKATIWKQEFVLISNGVNLDHFKAAGKKVTLALEKPIIMMAAASTIDKRVEQGIRAVAKLDRGSLLLLGTGPLDNRVNEIGYKFLGRKRFLHTSVKHDQMPEYYRSADLFTLCSASSEAFGIVYLEAMASGLACVATDDKSRREIVNNAGVFVKNPENATEYFTAIRKALSTDWGDLPRKQAEKFSWKEIGTKYENALVNLKTKS